jgi:hypothetical protein
MGRLFYLKKENEQKLVGGRMEYVQKKDKKCKKQPKFIKSAISQ